jgi:N-glycosylase/DNA lyase
MRYDLHVSGPIDLDLTFSCGQAFRWVRDAGAWRGIVGRAEVSVAFVPPTGLTVSVAGEDPGREALTRYLRLDEDPMVHLEHAEELRAVPGILPLFGLRLLRQDPWETVASFICSAAANLLKISRCVEAMAARWGEPIANSSRRAFPAADAIAGARESDLRASGLGFRAPYLLETARLIASAGWSWKALRDASYEDARGRLCGLSGVGPKIADCTLLFGLDRLEAYPVDRWIRRATLELWSRRRAKDEELRRWAERFGPGRGYLQQILFHLRRTQGPLPPLRRPVERRSARPLAPRARRIA